MCQFSDPPDTVGSVSQPNRGYTNLCLPRFLVFFHTVWNTVQLKGFRKCFGAVRNRTISVNLRKELVCSRAIHCASDIQRKEARELRDYER